MIDNVCYKINSNACAGGEGNWIRDFHSFHLIELIKNVPKLLLGWHYIATSSGISGIERYFAPISYIQSVCRLVGRSVWHNKRRGSYTSKASRALVTNYYLDDCLVTTLSCSSRTLGSDWFAAGSSNTFRPIIYRNKKFILIPKFGSVDNNIESMFPNEWNAEGKKSM